MGSGRLGLGLCLRKLRMKGDEHRVGLIASRDLKKYSKRKFLKSDP